MRHARCLGQVSDTETHRGVRIISAIIFGYRSQPGLDNIVGAMPGKDTSSSYVRQRDSIVRIRRGRLQCQRTSFRRRRKVSKSPYQLKAKQNAAATSISPTLCSMPLCLSSIRTVIGIICAILSAHKVAQRFFTSMTCSVLVLAHMRQLVLSCCISNARDTTKQVRMSMKFLSSRIKLRDRACKT